MPPLRLLRRCCVSDITSVSTSSSANQDRGNRNFGEASDDFRCDSGADHFTYMDSPPPGQPEPHPDAPAFRSRMAEEIAQLALA